MVYIVENDEIKDCWKDLIKLVYNQGSLVDDERGSVTKELMNIVVKIKNPLNNNNFFGLNKSNNINNIVVPEGYFWNDEKLKVYSEQFLSKDNPGFVYTYGSRLRNFGDEGLDQINIAIDRLKGCSESRRAISVTWNPMLDTVNDEVPCLILVDFKVRDGVLFTTALWRSHDIFGAWFPNVVGLSSLACYVANELDVSVGCITVHSISGHIYSTDFDAVKRFIS